VKTENSPVKVRNEKTGKSGNYERPGTVEIRARTLDSKMKLNEIVSAGAIGMGAEKKEQ